jgi:hypothetical protein
MNKLVHPNSTRHVKLPEVFNNHFVYPNWMQSLEPINFKKHLKPKDPSLRLIRDISSNNHSPLKKD